MAQQLVIVQKSFLQTIKSDYNEISASTIEDQTESDLKAHLQVLEADYKDCRKYHLQILQASGESDKIVADAYEKEGIMTAIRTTYRSFWSLLSERIESKQDLHKTASMNETQSVINKSAYLPADIKLPCAELRIFDGKYENWLPFYNLFKPTVHNNPHLEPVQKLHYLFQSVTGEAYKQIKNLILTDENYQIAIDILKDQYDHQRQTAHVYMKKILDYPTIKSESAEDFFDMLATIKDCLSSLELLNLPVKQWDYILLCIMQQKLPLKTYRKWEEQLGARRSIPTFTEFRMFLETNFRTLEMVEPITEERKAKEKEERKSKTFHIKTEERKEIKLNKSSKRPNNQQKKIECPLCKSNHGVSKCSKFLKLNVYNRKQIVNEHKLCENCLGKNHLVQSCFSYKTCVFCKPNHVRHHSLLHEHANQQLSTQSSNTQNHQNCAGPSNQRVYHISCHTDRTKLLGTAQVKIMNHQGYSINVRVLVDPCSEDNYITASTVQLLQLIKQNDPSSVSVIGDEIATECLYRVNFKILSLKGEFQTTTSAAIVKKITAELPSEYIPSSDCGFLNNLPLADPNYNHPGEIHLLLGSCFDAETIRPGLKKFGTHVYAQNTELGWIIRGRTSATKTNSSNVTFLTKRTEDTLLTEQMKKFWEIEEIPDQKPIHPEDSQCEQIFQNSIQQRSDGHLSIDLPFRHEEHPVIGPSRSTALRRFLNLEKKLSSNPKLKEEYHATMKDYIESGHMIATNNITEDGREYFLPHHAVFKESSSTTKVRVVFDASCKTEDGTSLNDHLMTGPKLQTDIRNILFNWRKYKFALTADIAKMYRMFYINDKHRSYQKILWRFDPKESLTDYTLCTVTFGTSSAPYLAIRMLLYIAETNKNKQEFQFAVQALEKEFYVDDFISGAHTIIDAIHKYKQLRELLQIYGLDIRKWSSNSPEVMATIPTNLHEISTQFSLDETEFRKTLGIYWSPKDDYFKFSIDRENATLTTLTKRKALSIIARIYDPMGWLSPCTLYAKILMQDIWRSGISWDDEVTEEVKPKFIKFLNQLHELEQIKIPRWTKLNNEDTPVRLIGFCDASTKGYGAVIYMETPLTDNDSTEATNQHLILLASKTKVAPITLTSIPRLELCAAVLLSELLNWSAELLHPRKVTITAFSDSQVVLHWLRGDPNRWKVYVSTRTTKIRKAVSIENWFYVHTTKNPADFASKGLLPKDIVNNNLWWHGPILETVSEEGDLTEKERKFIVDESKRNIVSLCTTHEENPFLVNYSSHSKVCKIIKVCSKFIQNCLYKLINKNPERKEKYSFYIQRINNPELILFRLVQKSSFHTEISDLMKNQMVNSASRLKTLHPFLDGFGILRVGGRLENSILTYNEKHPIILPASHRVTTNLIEFAHKVTLHGSNSLTHSYLRNKFHILRCSDVIKKVIDRCITCERYARNRHSQLMGSLPTDRVSINRPFLNTGVDYAGPLITREKRRNSSTTKSYIALFVCLSTKALHLEIVSDLSSQAFLAAYRRFVNRRGRVQRMYSDRGTNFVGASKILKEEIYKAEKMWKTELMTDFEELGTEWLFNPAAAPHFGGLWEAGVKSVKTHLVKIMGNKSLTFEELTTVTVQIEGILNSRPLCPLSNDPNNLVVLTPSHFLIGEPIIAPPEPVLNEEPKNCIDRWKHLQTIKQIFWKRYLKDYLNRLQRRPKWLKQKVQFKIGDIVLISDENCPPTIWPKAIIVDVHPGKDGQVRVVTIKNSEGKTFKRVTAKLRLLPINEIPDENELQINSH